MFDVLRDDLSDIPIHPARDKRVQGRPLGIILAKDITTLKKIQDIRTNFFHGLFDTVTVLPIDRHQLGSDNRIHRSLIGYVEGVKVRMVSQLVQGQ